MHHHAIPSTFMWFFLGAITASCIHLRVNDETRARGRHFGRCFRPLPSSSLLPPDPDTAALRAINRIPPLPCSYKFKPTLDEKKWEEDIHTVCQQVRRWSEKTIALLSGDTTAPTGESPAPIRLMEKPRLTCTSTSIYPLRNEPS